MRTINIRQKLCDLGVIVNDINMGDFDIIGEFTAKKQRQQNSDDYRHYGAFFRPNYERGILVYSLIKQKRLESFLEIGFGRGYATLCAAMAMDHLGIKGRIVTIDPSFNDDHLMKLRGVFPASWFSMIEFVKGTSTDCVPSIEGRFDLVYIDGDHSEAGVAADWAMVRDRFNYATLFDDYHLPTKNDPGIQCRAAIDRIDETTVGCSEKELIIMDRRIFCDDKQLPDEAIDYGQVLLTKGDGDAQ